MAGSGDNHWGSRGKVGGRFFARLEILKASLRATQLKTTPSPPPLQVHLFSLHTHTPLLFLHPDTRREGSSISNPTSDPPRQPDPSSLASCIKKPCCPTLAKY